MPNTFWKIYFGLFVVVSGFLLTLLVQPWENSAAHVVSLLFFLFTSLSLSVALFAYILQKKILTQIFWQVIALVNFSLFSLISLMSLIDLLAQTELFLIIIFLVCFSFLLPAYTALYLYAFRSAELWPQPATAKGKLLLWKIYFGLFVGVSSLLLLTLLVQPWENPVAHSFSLLFFLFTSLSLSVALFAYIWQKRILTQIFWQVIALVNFSLFSFGFIVSLIVLSSLTAQAGSLGIILFLVCFSFFLPAYTALYRYAFRSAELWPRLGTTKTKLLPWQSYFYFFLALYPITTVSYVLDTEFFADPEVTGWLKWLFLFDLILLTLISLIGLYAFSWRKRILQPIFWQIFFVIEVLVALIVTPYLIKVDLVSEPDLLSAPALILVWILALIICLPAYVANYLYAFKSKALWRKLKTN